jgi:glycine cleavage system H protein
MPEEYLETTVDKFVFRVKKGCYYNEEGVWVQVEDGLGRVGLSDFLQQSSGDMAFVEPKPQGTEVRQGETLGEIETIKISFDLASPVSGVIRDVNEALEDQPELVNEDPYGEGWVALLELTNLEEDVKNLHDAEAYFVVMKAKAEEEAHR